MRTDLPPALLLLLRYGLLAYLVGSVLFTIHYFYTEYQDAQPAPAIRPRTMTEQGQATFDVENIHYSSQIMKWKSTFPFIEFCMWFVLKKVCFVCLPTRMVRNDNYLWIEFFIYLNYLSCAIHRGQRRLTMLELLWLDE